MKILNLLEELEDLIDHAKKVPMTGMTVINKEDVFDLLKDIRMALPEEIQQAKLTLDERETIILGAKKEYDKIISEAEHEKEMMLEENEITQSAIKKANEMLDKTEKHIQDLKLGTYGYVDKILYDFQEKIEELKNKDFADIMTKTDSSFNTLTSKIVANRREIRELEQKTQAQNSLKG
jgi:glutamyl-tRNA reductase